MTIKEKFNEYIASDDALLLISDEQRDILLPFIERCVGEERSRVETIIKDRQKGWLGDEEDGSDRHPHYDELQNVLDTLTQEDKIK